MHRGVAPGGVASVRSSTRALLAALGAALLAGPAPAAEPDAPPDLVTPTDDVGTHVWVREAPDRSSRRVGRLARGEQAVHLDSVEGWHQVELGDATRGYVSDAWTRRVERTAPEPPPARPERPVREPRESFVDRIGGWLRREPAVEVALHQPQADRAVFRHPEPRLPVSGYAATADSNGLVELVLAVDASTSANEFSGADVDGDGLLEDEWGGDDSVFRAQLAAARGFVDALRRLPGNEEGERIRIAVITFAGDERFRGYEPDRDFEPTTISILALARRDARLHAPLTSDYAAVDAALEALEDHAPRGMTDLAAAIALALMELEGLSETGAASQPRPGAQRVVDFLTDGMPSLPYDRERAELAARYAARLAAERGLRVNVFELGSNAVTRRLSATSARIAELTGGALVPVPEPEEIGPLLRATSLTFVERVRLENRSLGERSSYIATGIDGSFYGEIPLREGENEITVVARLFDGSEKALSFPIEYRQGLPEPELEARLEDIRARNEVLIEQIRDRLAREMEVQRKSLEVAPAEE